MSSSDLDLARALSRLLAEATTEEASSERAPRGAVAASPDPAKFVRFLKIAPESAPPGPPGADVREAGAPPKVSGRAGGD